MPLELQIIRASEFIRVGTKGRLDLETSHALLKDLAAACRRRGIDRALLDLRGLEAGTARMLTPHDIATLVGAFHEIGFTLEQRLAVLYTADPFHGARLFAFLGTLRGWRVRASDRFEEIFTWLAGTGDPGEEEYQPTHTQSGTDLEPEPPAAPVTNRIETSDASPPASRPLPPEIHKHGHSPRRFASRKEKT